LKQNSSERSDDMPQSMRLRASDGFEFGAYRSDPVGKKRGAVVVLQEIFGVNHHIHSICERFSAVGYVAIAPALFDRKKPGFETGYAPDEVQQARDFMAGIDRETMMLNVAAAVEAARPLGPVGVVGYCLGGSLAYLSALRIEGLSAAICYYGGLIAKNAEHAPKCPTQMHFGADDRGIPVSDVEAIRASRPDCEVWLYDGAGHGFNCDERSAYEPASSAISWMRTAEWFGRYLR
jgi:carboxymethylenebutenolidase